MQGFMKVEVRNDILILYSIKIIMINISLICHFNKRLIVNINGQYLQFIELFTKLIHIYLNKMLESNS